MILKLDQKDHNELIRRLLSLGWIWNNLSEIESPKYIIEMHVYDQFWSVKIIKK